MPKYEILVRGKASKQIKQLPAQYFRLDAKKLKGDVGYSLRVGTYRILYDIDDEMQKVTIYRVKHRRDVYRGF